GNNIDGIMASAVDTFVANIRAVDATILDEVSALPATLNVSLDNAIANPGSAYTLTRADGTVEYLEKTAAKFTGANDSNWKNNLLINVGEYKADYKWVLVDFYFNSDTVMIQASGEYATLTYGSECDNGAFYVVDGEYNSVAAAKNQWITIAFKIENITGDYINAIMSNAVDTYVANIRVVKASVLDEVVVTP
ncbi:MAG: hypothetical protein J5697_02840, partial [Clostridia bacterium]|nr:hypothetical protein [Clostridia bacterium]